MARFADLINDVESRMNNTTQTTLVKRWLNQAMDEVQVFYDWSFLLEEQFFQTTAKHSDGTGTIGATNASTAITGTGTNWTAAMTGRKIRIVTDNEWYYFTYVSATTGTLDRAYEGTTTTTGDYSIFEDIYKLQGNVNKVKLLRNLGQSRSFQWANNTEFDLAIPTITTESSPRVVVVRGRGADTYTTGTVEGTSGSNTITGTSTAWTSGAGIGIGSKIRIGNYTYTVKSLDSTTQVTIYEPLEDTVAALTTYVFNINNMRVQIWPPPATSVGIPYKFFRIIPPLVNDWDESEIPEKYHRILIEGACKRAFIYQYDQQKVALAKGEFNEGLLLMKQDYMQTVDKVNVLRSEDSLRRKNVFFVPSNFGSLS